MTPEQALDELERMARVSSEISQIRFTAVCNVIDQLQREKAELAATVKKQAGVLKELHAKYGNYFVGEAFRSDWEKVKLILTTPSTALAEHMKPAIEALIYIRGSINTGAHEQAVALKALTHYGVKV